MVSPAKQPNDGSELGSDDLVQTGGVDERICEQVDERQDREAAIKRGGLLAIAEVRREG